MFSPLFTILKGTGVKLEKDTYYWITFFSAFFILHLTLTTQNRNYLSIYILMLGLIIFDVYKAYNDRYTEDEESIQEFLETLISETQEHDVVQGSKMSKYTFAKVLLRSDVIILSWLQKFKRLGMNQKESYQLITSSILRFYQSYGIMLRLEKKVKSQKVSLQDLILMQKNIMNLIHQFEIQVLHVKSVQKEVQQFSLVILASLSRCLKVIRNKYQMFEEYAPYPQNVSGDIYELY